MDKVAGFLEVSRMEDEQKIVIEVPNFKPDASGAARIVLSPRYARHLASLLIEHAAIVEADADTSLSSRKDLPQRNQDGKLSGPA